MSESRRLVGDDFVNDILVGLFAGAAILSVFFLGFEIGGAVPVGDPVDTDFVGIAALTAITSIGGIVHVRRET